MSDLISPLASSLASTLGLGGRKRPTLLLSLALISGTLARPFASTGGICDIIDQLEKQLELARKDALHRGMIGGMDETPRAWAMWQMGSWKVVFANPDDCKDILTKHEQFEKMSLDELPVDYFDLFLGRNIVQARTPIWKIHRRIVNPAFRRTWPTWLFGHPTRFLLSHFDRFAAHGQPIDVADWMQRITLDVLSGAAFGSSLIRLVLAAMVFGRLVPRVRQMYRDIDGFNGHVNGLIDQTMARILAGEVGQPDGEDESSNLLELMVKAQMKDSEQFSREELRANIAAFFAAGHDTTANALTFTIYLLGMHPDIQQRARNEVIAVMGDLGDRSTDTDSMPFPSNTEQNQLEYLTCIIKESTRLYPPLISVPPRTLMSPYTFTKSNIHVPANGSVTASIWALHRAKEYWGADALKFNPDRWKRANDPASMSDDDGVTEAATPSSVPLHPGAHGFQWVPFGGGQRLCIGQSFSVIEQRVVMAMLLLRYTWTVVGNEAALAGRPQSSPGVLLHPVGIMVQMNRR
ncbi:cytochrome P450 [Catenaria anguillulae PL171]|uniref:Cytochrome P450 n=1 Tax=Catenaria anguillulae PL171 TaxID=765915 RepID=A0A1Y2HJZ5_9FUNG|nr:cytochrome P450 [Catenaria anguillulae PL171]